MLFVFSCFSLSFVILVLCITLLFISSSSRMGLRSVQLLHFVFFLFDLSFHIFIFLNIHDFYSRFETVILVHVFITCFYVYVFIICDFLV